MISKVYDSVWKFAGESNVYLLELDEKILIDTGNRANRALITQFLGKVVDFGAVTKVIFTHLHYDHIGNFDLFPNATFYASAAEIEDYKKDPVGAIASEDMAEKFTADLTPIETMPPLEIIKTPGHTRGSICIWYPEPKILFTGDTVFKKGSGRVDLPTSAPAEIRKSLIRLIDYNYKILCPGHDY